MKKVLNSPTVDHGPSTNPENGLRLTGQLIKVLVAGPIVEEGLNPSMDISPKGMK